MSLCNLRFLEELTYLHVVVECESLLGGHCKACFVRKFTRPTMEDINFCIANLHKSLKSEFSSIGCFVAKSPLFF